MIGKSTFNTPLFNDFTFNEETLVPEKFVVRLAATITVACSSIWGRFRFISGNFFRTRTVIGAAPPSISWDQGTQSTTHWTEV